MAEELKNKPAEEVEEVVDVAEGQPEDVEDERPNRTRYAAMWQEDNPDVDFEDKEARYGRLAEERAKFREYRRAGKALSDVFDKNRWLATMLIDLRDNPELNPLTWMAKNGIDIQEALSDPEYAETIAQKIEDYQKHIIEAEQYDTEREDNLRASAEKLKAMGFDEQEAMDMWTYLFENIVDPALHGNVDEQVWNMIHKANAYDGDVLDAEERGAARARNEKIQNKIKEMPADIPPTLSQGGAEQAAPKVEKKPGFFSDLENY